MVFCIVAMVVFGILAIFSASHRAYAKEAFNCVFHMVTLRKCESNFDQKMKMKISTGIMKVSPKSGAFVFRHFTLLSWILTIAMILSFAYSAYALYNLATTGSCDPAHPEQCVFNPQTSQQLCNCEFDLSACKVSDFAACGNDCACLKPRCGPG